MQRHVARELARARVKHVRRGGKPPETPVLEVVDALVRTLARTGIEARFEAHIDSTLMVALDRIDLMEVIGNLLENASRYAVSLVLVQDVLDAYGATMKFSRSDLGGLRVSIDLSPCLLEENHCSGMDDMTSATQLNRRQLGSQPLVSPMCS